MAPARDSASLARDVIRLLDDEHERNRLAVAGRALYTARFDAALTIAALRNLPAPQVVPANTHQYSDERSA
jgi:hypothetical protein